MVPEAITSDGATPRPRLTPVPQVMVRSAPLAVISNTTNQRLLAPNVPVGFSIVRFLASAVIFTTLLPVRVLAVYGEAGSAVETISQSSALPPPTVAGAHAEPFHAIACPFVAPPCANAPRLSASNTGSADAPLVTSGSPAAPGVRAAQAESPRYSSDPCVAPMMSSTALGGRISALPVPEVTRARTLPEVTPPTSPY